MKLKLLCRKEMKEQLLDDLQKGQVTVCEDADYVLYEANYDYRYLLSGIMRNTCVSLLKISSI